MKSKLLVICLLMVLMPFSIVQAKPLPLSLEIAYVDPKDNQSNPQRSPVFVPKVNLDIHTLYFKNIGYDLTLVLINDDDEVVYTTFVPAYTASLFIPLYLNDTYEIRLYPGGNYYFYSDITL